MKKIILFVVCLFLACGEVTPPDFNGDRAYNYIVEQVAFGPRVPGSEAWKECRDYFYKHFEALGFRVDSQVFSFYDPYSKSELPLVNVIAHCPGRDSESPGILLAAHYDSRPRTDSAHNPEFLNDPIDGANDGGSGVAVLMELANLFKESPPACNVDLFLTDGEDWGKVGDHELYLLGAREFARHGIRNKYRFGIVVDMIGDADQQIYRDALSERYNKKYNDMIWEAAAALNIPTMIDSVKYGVLDDHMPINSGGVPCVVMIDFDYPYWHTEFDSPDKCSPQSLSNVGRVLTRIVYNKSLWP